MNCDSKTHALRGVRRHHRYEMEERDCLIVHTCGQSALVVGASGWSVPARPVEAMTHYGGPASGGAASSCGGRA